MKYKKIKIYKKELIFISTPYFMGIQGHRCKIFMRNSYLIQLGLARDVLS